MYRAGVTEHLSYPRMYGTSAHHCQPTYYAPSSYYGANSTCGGYYCGRRIGHNPSSIIVVPTMDHLSLPRRSRGTIGYYPPYRRYPTQYHQAVHRDHYRDNFRDHRRDYRRDRHSVSSLLTCVASWLKYEH